LKASTHEKTPHCGVFSWYSRTEPGKLFPITWQQVQVRLAQQQVQQLAQQLRRLVQQQEQEQQRAQRQQVLEQQVQRLLLFCRKRTKQQQR
jgi:hypothetical protein